MALFRSFNEVGVTVMIATHDATSAATGRILHLDHGVMPA
jgi:ABC-type ATPase involved in cell division